MEHYTALVTRDDCPPSGGAQLRAGAAAAGAGPGRDHLQSTTGHDGHEVRSAHCATL